MFYRIKYWWRRRQLLNSGLHGEKYFPDEFLRVREAIDKVEQRAFTGEIPMNNPGICFEAGFMGIERKYPHSVCRCFLSLAREFNKVHGIDPQPWAWPIQADQLEMTWEGTNLKKRLALMQWVIHTIDTYNLGK